MPEGYKVRVRCEVLRADRGILKFELDAPVENLLEIEGDLYQYVEELVDDEGTYVCFEPAKIRKVDLGI